MKLVLDIETTYQKEGRKTDPSPYHKNNKLVSVGYKGIDADGETYLFFNHKENDCTIPSAEILQSNLNRTKLLVGHNLKFDMSWLYECGFKYTGKLWDTMIFEYILAKGVKPSLSLSSCAEKYGLTLKSDILMEYMSKGVNVDEIPAKELEEYGRGDIQTTYELYLKQQELIANSPEIQSMMPVIEMSMQVLPVLIDMERNGIYINQEDLKTVEMEYRLESARLEKLMQEMVIEVMGHRPINLNSPEHLSWVIYSRKVKDKEVWAGIFNIGMEDRGAVAKRKYVPRFALSKLKKIVVSNMETLKKQEAFMCEACQGVGTIQKVKVDGTLFKRRNNCPSCSGNKFIYVDTVDTAGFKVQPIDSTYATSSGFATDKTTISDLIRSGKLRDKAREFLECLAKYNAIQTYLNTFVEGIQKNIRQDLMLHTSLNQCITATGRLSSSNPNFQNLPRGNTFPVRKVIQSRFKDGWILEADFAQLEFRTAAMLAACPVALQDILNKVDIHAYTAKVLMDAGHNFEKAGDERQEAKAHTFKPLYGGMTGTLAEVTYYKAFLDKYTGIKNWHMELITQACGNKQVQIPSGRIYAFPNARRMDSNRVIGKTQIVNYPVQGFATADIAWVVILDIYEQMCYHNTKSKLILQVHDSVIADVHPDEKDLMIMIFKSSFDKTASLLEKWFNFKTEVPIDYELAIGKNLMQKEKIAV